MFRVREPGRHTPMNADPLPGTREVRFVRVSQLTVLSLLAVACSPGLDSPTAEIYLSDGRTGRLVPAEHAPRLERALRDLLSSCSSNNSDWAGTPDNWRTAEAEPSILARYRVPIRVRTVREAIEVDAILFAPLSPEHRFADHLFARRGEEIYAFGKWGPRVAAELICDPYTEMKHSSRIREFCDMMDAR